MLHGKATAKKLPFGETTNEGPWYGQVGGANVGTATRAFWPTKAEALACAQDYASKRDAYLASQAA